MDEIKTAVDDLIEETRMRELDDEQIEWRVRKFTEICTEMIEARVGDIRKRKMLIERLQIMKCFYDHSSVKQPTAGMSSRELDERQRHKRLGSIVRRRRMALAMIERVDPKIALEIKETLDKAYANPAPRQRRPAPVKEHGKIQDHELPRLSPHHWYFLYFNLFLMICLICMILLVVK
jgi:hypothetical protein